MSSPVEQTKTGAGKIMVARDYATCGQRAHGNKCFRFNLLCSLLETVHSHGKSKALPETECASLCIFFFGCCWWWWWCVMVLRKLPTRIVIEKFYYASNNSKPSSRKRARDRESEKKAILELQMWNIVIGKTLLSPTAKNGLFVAKTFYYSLFKICVLQMCYDFLKVWRLLLYFFFVWFKKTTTVDPFGIKLAWAFTRELRFLFFFVFFCFPIFDHAKKFNHRIFMVAYVREFVFFRHAACCSSKMPILCTHFQHQSRLFVRSFLCIEQP